MTKANFDSVDAYIEAQPQAVRGMLQTVRKAIRRAIPQAEETISYKMPTYLLNGDRLIYFAAWKQHYSLYAATAKVGAKFNDELAAYKIEKGTIRFPLSQPAPVKLIERIIKFRAKELAARSARPPAAGPPSEA